ncbi:MAG: rhamnogalacturonan acetylesterase [Lachnospiraceae bacterium]|nr:rhamnogalacturonan acetylesterase [Lachnospiraceae bacterium]
MKSFKKIMAVFMLAVGVFVVGGAVTGVKAAKNPEDIIFKSFKDNEGLVEGSWEYVIPAKPGENFNIEITFTGSISADTTLSFTYDYVTDDQMVANVQKADSSDRSGLFNESVSKGKEEVRSFSVAAMTGDIVITASGQGKILSINAVKQNEKTKGDKVTVYTIGDSLVQTYSERYAPQTGWGQTMELYFNDNVKFVNRALGGRSTGNFLRQGRLNQVLCEVVPGDYVLIEFGHNDADSSKVDRYVSTPNFKENLKLYIQAIRDRGATPILVTLCNRNQYVAATDEFRVSYPDYVKAMKAAAEESETLLIDLNAITVERFHGLIKELGKNITNEIIYNHAIAGAYEGDYAKGVADNTHLQYYGAKLVAGYVAEELQKLNLTGLSENYVPLAVGEIPSAPTGITEKKVSGFVSRIKWKESIGADYYKVLVAEIAEVVKTIPCDDDSKEEASSVKYEEPEYALVGDFTIAGYTTVCDFSYKAAEEGKHYAYKIVAINAAGESEESEIFDFGLLPDEKADDGQPGTDEGTQDDKNDSEKDGGINPVVIAVIAVAVVAVIIAAVIILKKKNKK